MTKAEVLDRAKAAVCGERGDTYGPPSTNFQRTADHWNLYLGSRGIVSSPRLLTRADVAALNVLQKIARLEETPEHLDSLIDIAGYAACWAEVVGIKDGWE